MSPLYYYLFFLMIRRPPRSTLFPTRRSSDLVVVAQIERSDSPRAAVSRQRFNAHRWDDWKRVHIKDRKSTRLNSSHRCISYAVFCLKKKKKYTIQPVSYKNNYAELLVSNTNM